MRISRMVLIITERLVPTATNLSSSASSSRLNGSTVQTLSTAQEGRQSHEDPRPDCDGDESRQMHWLSYVFGHLQERLDLATGHGIRVVQQCRNQAGYC